MHVTVCLASFNGAKYIREQVQSILGQLRANDELIISDNGSTDGTVGIIEDIHERRISIFRCERRGVVSNFQNAIERATGDAIFLADQDDVWLQGRVEKMTRVLDDFDLVVSDCRVVDQSLCVVHDSLFALRGSGPGFLKNLWKNSYVGCCMAFNRKIRDAVLPFPEGIPAFDWWIGLVAEKTGTIKFLEGPSLLYRRHGANASETAEGSSAGRLTQAMWRFTLLREILRRSRNAR